MNSFILKAIACITMFIDHIGYVIFNGTSYFNYIGRLSFPIFAFQISEGYTHTKNVKKYLSRLIIFTIISQIPFMLFISIISDSFSLNVIFTLIFGLLSIIIYDKFNRFLGITVAVFLGILANILRCDYGFYGVAITFLFYAFRNSKLQLAFAFIIATAVKYGYDILAYYKYGKDVLKIAFEFYLPYAICTMLSSIFIVLYNKKKGPNTRYLLYLFYPLHMLLIYGISLVLQS